MSFVKVKSKQDFINLLNYVSEEIAKIDADITGKERSKSWFDILINYKFQTSDNKRNI